MNKEERIKNLKEEIIEKLKGVTNLKELNDLKVEKRTYFRTFIINERNTK